MGWWSSLKRKVFGTSPSPNDDTAPPETSELSFDNPLLEFSTNILIGWGKQVGDLIPVLKKFSLDPVMSSVSEAQMNNIKAILPVLGTDILITCFSHYMTTPHDSSNITETSNNNNPVTTWYLAATSIVTLLQISVHLYDMTVGRKNSLNVSAERLFTPANTSTSTIAKQTAPCTDNCLSFQVALNGNIYKALHHYTNLWFIDTWIKPTLVIGPWLGFYLEVMAEGRHLLNLGTTYCGEHKTLQPETALAYGSLFNLHKYLWQWLLADVLGVPSSHVWTYFILKEIPLILSTALVCESNPKPIHRYKAPLPEEKLSIKTRFYKRIRYMLYDPLGQYESVMEWFFEAFLIGLTSQISKELQKPGTEIDWEAMNKQLQILNNHFLFQITKAIVVPKFLQSWENLANHPPIKHHWERNRKQLLMILEKIFQVKNSTLGHAAEYKPEYAALLIQYFLSIKASIAQELIIKLGDEQTMKLLHAFYWWLGKHGAHTPAGLENMNSIIATTDKTIEYSPGPGFSREKFHQHTQLLLTYPSVEAPIINTENKMEAVPSKTMSKEPDPIPANSVQPVSKVAEIIPLHQSTPTFFNPMTSRPMQPPRQNAEPVNRKNFRQQILEENAGLGELRNRSQNASFFKDSVQTDLSKTNLTKSYPAS